MSSVPPPPDPFATQPADRSSDRPSPSAKLDLSALPTGATVDRYLVLERTGQGALGAVYKAYDRELDRFVAIKVLRTRRYAGESKVEMGLRLLREAQAMAKLDHPNVVPVYDFGLHDENVFLAMAFVEGETLAAWLRRERRSVASILRVFVAAGNGLSAAHKAGLVHRDFKPDNVVVGSDGSVRVLDFGLARHVSPAPPSPDPAATVPPPPPSGGAIEPASDSDRTAGTPFYMSPEQYLGRKVDARADQFAFCVALFEALYGQHPFFDARGTLRDLMKAITSGAMRQLPRPRSVSRRVAGALKRGLSLDAEQRFPSMDELLGTIRARSGDPLRAPAAWLALAAGVMVLGGVQWRAHITERAQLCAGGEIEAAEVWNPDVQRRIESAMLATGVPYAADTWRRTREQVDLYMHRWATSYRQTCEATRLHQAQPESTMTVRMACLQQRRDEVRALTQVLSSADREVASKALQASMALTDLDRCKDSSSWTAVQPEPGDPAARAEIAAIRKELAAVNATREAGLASAARDRAEPLIARARAVGYRPLLGEVLFASARAKGSNTSFDEIIAQAAEAEEVADRGRADGLRVDIATDLITWTRRAGSMADAEKWSRVADAAMERAGEDSARRADWLNAMGLLRSAQGRYEDAADFLGRALDTGRRASLGPAPVARIEMSLAYDEASLGHAREAQRLADEADDVVVRAMGAEHPIRVGYLAARAFASGAGGDVHQALALDQQAIALAERVAPDDTELQLLYNDVCTDLYDLGDCTGARPYCTKAIESSRRVSGPDSQYLSYAYGSLGDVLCCLHEYDDAAADFESSVAIFERTATVRDPGYVHSLLGVGQSRLLAGKASEALPLLEKTLSVVPGGEGKLESEKKDAAGVRFALAQALWQTGRRSPRVAELARTAADIDERSGNGQGAGEVRAWLQSHR